MRVELGDVMFWVRYTRERHLVIVPPSCKRPGILRPYGDYFGFKVHIFLMVLTQLRHVRPAVRSKEASVEDENNALLSSVIRKANCAPFAVGGSEIGRDGSLRSLDHTSNLLARSPRIGLDLASSLSATDRRSFAEHDAESNDC